MAEPQTDKDPNEQYPLGGADHKPLSEQEAWGTNLNPVRETPSPFGAMRQGGAGAK